MKLKQDPTIYILPYSKCVVYDALKVGSPQHLCNMCDYKEMYIYDF